MVCPTAIITDLRYLRYLSVPKTLPTPYPPRNSALLGASQAPPLCRRSRIQSRYQACIVFRHGVSHAFAAGPQPVMEPWTLDCHPKTRCDSSTTGRSMYVHSVFGAALRVFCPKSFVHPATRCYALLLDLLLSAVSRQDLMAPV